MRATDNLKVYMSNAILPPIQVIDEPLSFYDDQGERLTPALTRVIPANWRQLHTMRRLDPLQLTNKILARKWATHPPSPSAILTITHVVHERFPDTPLGEPNYDPQAGVDLCIPSSSEFKLTPISMSGGPAATIIEEVVLQTATRALHLLYPSSKEWCFLEVDDLPDDKLKVRIFGLTRPITASKDSDRHSMLIFVFTKWAFEKYHIREFVEMKSVKVNSRDQQH
jgi:hypothetical protein